MKKGTVIDTMNDLPEKFELDELIEKLLLVEKVEKGLSQLDSGKTKTHSEVKKIVAGWKK
ncbi:MAG: hypothetical protein KA149_03585 [Chitinophagales bacterium]|jgi:hypothetical protein|nr:hypothetical protein [Chitinophagales bacterium]